MHANADYANTKPGIQGIRLFGDTMWATPSSLAKTGHLYSYDENQNATFPASIIQNSSAHEIYSKGGLKANGATTLGGTLTVTGKTTLNGELSLANNATFSKNLTVNGDATLGDIATDKIILKGITTANAMIYATQGLNVYTGSFSVSSTSVDINNPLYVSKTSSFLSPVTMSNGLTVDGGDIDFDGVLYINTYDEDTYNSIEALGDIYTSTIFKGYGACIGGSIDISSGAQNSYDVSGFMGTYGGNDLGAFSASVFAEEDAGYIISEDGFIGSELITDSIIITDNGSLLNLGTTTLIGEVGIDGDLTCSQQAWFDNLVYINTLTNDFYSGYYIYLEDTAGHYLDLTATYFGASNDETTTIEMFLTDGHITAANYIEAPEFRGTATKSETINWYYFDANGTIS